MGITANFFVTSSIALPGFVGVAPLYICATPGKKNTITGIKNPLRKKRETGTTYGIRTRDSSVKGRRLNPLTNAALIFKDGKDTMRNLASQIF